MTKRAKSKVTTTEPKSAAEAPKSEASRSRPFEIGFLYEAVLDDN